jgi:type I restriction enzyme S subunit
MSNKVKISLVPKLRFPEFQEAKEWEGKTLREVCLRITNGKANAEDHEEDGIYPLFDRSAVIKRSNTFMFDSEAVILPGEGMRFVPKYFSGKFNLHQRAYALMEHQGDARFVYYTLDYLKDLLAKKAVKSTVLSLRLPIVENFPISCPKLSEQQKIADCLSSLDDLIAEQARKVEALKIHKKGLMQQLFPREGETQPRLRFPEFRGAGEWVEKKLSTIAELTSSKRVHLSDYVANGIPFFRGKEISLLKNNQVPEDILYISEEHYEEIRNKYGVPKIGDILITAVGTLGNVYCIQNLNKFYFKDGNLIWMKDISEDSAFLELLLNVGSKKVLSSAIGSSQKALTMVELNKLKFSFPKKEEQQRLADCLTSLDDLITTATQQFETLKTHKKGLMQQLFPSVDAVEV